MLFYVYYITGRCSDNEGYESGCIQTLHLLV